MQIGVPRESRPRETRVAATPKTVGQLVGLGYDVVVETGAGSAASFSDEAYAAAGARVLSTPSRPGAATSCTRSTPPSDEEIARLRPGAVLVSLLAPALAPELVEKLRAAGVTAMAMDAVPRISRAQSLDVLSLDGQHRRLPGRRRGGPRVRLVLHRPGDGRGQGAAREGARRRRRRRGPRRHRHRPVARRDRARDRRARRGGRAGRVDGRRVPRPCRCPRSRLVPPRATATRKEMGEEYNRRAAELYAAQAPDADIIVTTALIPGRPAPRLITGEMVAAMKPGSVIVDMAAPTAATSRAPSPTSWSSTAGGVTIIGYTDLAAPPAHPGLAALRHQPRQPHEAADAGQGRAAWSSTSTTSCSAP